MWRRERMGWSPLCKQHVVKGPWLGSQGLLWVEVCSSEIYIEVLTPVPVNMTLFGNSVWRCNHLMMRLLWKALIQYDWYPYKKKKKKKPCEDRGTQEGAMCHGDRWKCCSCEPRNTTNWWPPPESRKRQERILLYRFQSEDGPADTLTLNFQPPNLQDNTFMLF